MTDLTQLRDALDQADALRATGIHTLIVLDDSRRAKGNLDALIRQEIAERYNRTVDNGGTAMPFREWKAVLRVGMEATP